EVKEPEPVKKVQKYFLIAGCFEYKENADRLTDKLNKEGYDSKIISYYENLYLVSYDGFPTHQEAQVALRKIRQENDKKDTWIYPTR
ncbi:MAG: SPOR domain-containing protein, partial [Odoribacter sp.]|nr:SPOR domain-containing protein [Odoribacter sp.]